VTTLKPNYIRAFTKAFGFAFVVIVSSILIERICNGYWESASYLASLCIPLFLFPVFCCVAFVPSRIEWSETEFRIYRKFGKPATFSWSNLAAFGRGRGTFLIQFSGQGAFQIYSGAFDRTMWRTFVDFLASNFPDKKARFWVGTRAVKTG
jgi:hypothetical protein